MDVNEHYDVAGHIYMELDSWWNHMYHLEDKGYKVVADNTKHYHNITTEHCKMQTSSINLTFVLRKVK